MNVLKLHVLCATYIAVTIITDHSIALFVIHHAIIILLLGNYGTATLHGLHILYLNGNLLIWVLGMPVQVYESEGPLPKLLLEYVLCIIMLDILWPYVLRTLLWVDHICIINYITL